MATADRNVAANEPANDYPDPLPGELFSYYVWRVLGESGVRHRRLAGESLNDLVRHYAIKMRGERYFEAEESWEANRRNKRFRAFMLKITGAGDNRGRKHPSSARR